MANPPADYPGAVHTVVDTSGSGDTPLGETTPKHTEQHGKLEEEMAAVQAKVGPGASVPLQRQVLGSIFGEESSWLPWLATYQSLGMNIGNDQIGEDSFPTDQNRRDLAILRRFTNKLRIAIPYHLQTNAVANAKKLALMGQKFGFEVCIGVTAGAETDLTDYNTWKNTSVPAIALWAHQNGIRTVYIGNEEDWNAQAAVDNDDPSPIAGKTPTQIRDDVRALATSLSATYPDIRFLYSTAQGCVVGWDEEGTGDLDALGINMYDTLDNFAGNLAYFLSLSFGDKMFISELGEDGPFPAGAGSDDEYRFRVQARINLCRTQGIEVYWFTWRTPDDGDWGLRQSDDSYLPGYGEIFSLPTL